MTPIAIVRIRREGMFQRCVCYTHADILYAISVADLDYPVEGHLVRD